MTWSTCLFLVVSLSILACSETRMTTLQSLRGGLPAGLDDQTHSCPVSPQTCTNEIWANCSDSSNVTCSASHVCFRDRCVSSSNYTGLSCNGTGASNVCSAFSALEVTIGNPPVICYFGVCQAAGFPNEKCQSELCIGNATCVNGTCVGVQPGGKCIKKPYDDCDPSSYCAENSTCVRYASVGENCSLAKCDASSYCATMKGPSNSSVNECVAKYAVSEGFSCQSEASCEFGLVCHNKTCTQPVGAGKPCNISNVGNMCNGTIPQSVCMCNGDSETPTCLPLNDGIVPTPESCTKGLGVGLKCMTQNNCYAPDSTMVYLGDCFHQHCSASQVEDCYCDIADEILPNDDKHCNTLEFCKGSSSKMPLWLLLVIVFGACCGVCCIIGCCCSIGCSILNAIVQVLRLVFLGGSGGRGGYEYIN